PRMWSCSGSTSGTRSWMYATSPIKTRALTAGGSNAVSRNTAHVSPPDTITAVSAPTFAWSSSGPWNARFAMSSATVKPTPAIVPLPSTAAQPTGGRIRPRDSTVTAHAVNTTPSGLPTTYPTNTPSVTGAVNAVASTSPDSTTPALASANSGTITKLVHGW